MKSSSSAYAEYRRIHAEQGIQLPSWESLQHVQRMAWEAAIQHIVDPENRPKSTDEYRLRPVSKKLSGG